MRAALAFLILWLAAFGGAQSEERKPVVVPGRLQSGVWFIEGTMSGRPTLFMVDTGANGTAILPSATYPEGPVDVQIKVGELNFSTKAYSTKLFLLEYLKAVAEKLELGDRQVAMLGADVLRNLAFGFDYETSAISFWPRGRLEAKAAQAWVGAGAIRLELNRNLGNLLGFSATVGKWKGGLLLDTGTTTSTLMPENAEKTGAAEVYELQTVLTTSGQREMAFIAPNLMLGKQPFPWFTFRRSEMTKGMEKVFGGAISLGAFRSRRVLIDYVAEVVYFAPALPETTSAIVLGQFSSVPFTIEGGVLKVGKVASSVLSDHPELEGCEVQSVAGHPASAILEALSGKGKDPLGLVGDLFQARKKGYSVFVKTPRGAQELQIAGVS